QSAAYAAPRAREPAYRRRSSAAAARPNRATGWPRRGSAKTASAAAPASRPRAAAARMRPPCRTGVPGAAARADRRKANAMVVARRPGTPCRLLSRGVRARPSHHARRARERSEQVPLQLLLVGLEPGGGAADAVASAGGPHAGPAAALAERPGAHRRVRAAEPQPGHLDDAAAVARRQAVRVAEQPQPPAHVEVALARVGVDGVGERGPV